jgi:hypothetical protein
MDIRNVNTFPLSEETTEFATKNHAKNLQKFFLNWSMVRNKAAWGCESQYGEYVQ